MAHIHDTKQNTQTMALGWVLGGLLGVAAVVVVAGQHPQQQLFTTNAPQQQQVGFLAALLGPNLTVESFWRERWQRRPLFVKRGAGGSSFYDAFPVVRGADLLDLLATCRPHVGPNGKPAKDWRLVKQEPSGAADALPFADGPCAGERAMWEDQYCRIAHAADAFAKGFTVGINMVQGKNLRALQLAEGFTQETGMLTSVNLYWSPMGSQAFDIHYDNREVFALQVGGLD